MSFQRILLLFFAFAFIVFIGCSKQSEIAKNKGSEKVDYYAIPNIRVVGKTINVSHSLKNSKYQPTGKFIGIPKVIYKQNDKIVHEGVMNPG